MELYDLESAREPLEQLWHIRDPSRSFAGVPVGKGIPCYLLSGNLDKLKLFFFCLANHSQCVLDLGEGKQTESFQTQGCSHIQQLQGSGAGFVGAREGKPTGRIQGTPFSVTQLYLPPVDTGVF